MGERVTFRRRGRGKSIKDSSEGVSFVEPRVKYVKGDLLTTNTDPALGPVKCGAGTAYPLEVNVSQLAEILYRVKATEIIAGGITASYYGGDDVYSWVRGTGTLPLTLVEVVNSIVSIRGLCTISNDVAPARPLDSYGLDQFKAAYYNTIPFSSTSLAARDIGTSEYAIWANSDLPNDTEISKFWTGIITINFTDNYQPSTFRTAFSNYFGNDEGSITGVYGVYNTLTQGATTLETVSRFSVEFSGNVAFVDVTGSGDPFDSGNRLFIGMTFVAYALEPVGYSEVIAIQSDASTDYGYGAAVPITPQLTLGLSGGSSVSCPLYRIPDSSEVYYDGNMTGTDFVIQATEWWPYANPNGTPKYKDSTGLVP